MRSRYLIVLFLWIIAMPQALMAQKKGSAEYEAKLAATMVAIDSILSSHGLNEPLEAFCDKLIEQYKNDPRLAFHVAEQFSRSKLQQHDIAYRRMEQLIKKYPKYMDGYLTYAELLVGRSERQNFDDSLVTVTRAKQIIDTCKVALPDSIEPYMKWIRMFLERDYKEVDKEAEALHNRFPNYPVYSDVAKLYAFKDDNILLYRSLYYLQKEDRNSMNANLLTFYVNLYGLLGKYEEGLDVANYAIEKYPDFPLLAQKLLMMNAKLGSKEKDNKNADMAKMYYTDAITASEKLFSTHDTLKLSYTDYLYSGDAYQYLKQSKKAVEMYRNMLTAYDFDYKKNASDWETAVEGICEHYKTIGFLDSTIIAYKDYLTKREEIGLSIKDYHLYYFADYYDGYSEELMGEEKIQTILCADSAYLQMFQISDRINMKILACRQHIARLINLEPLRVGKLVWGEEIRDELLKVFEYSDTLNIDEIPANSKALLADCYYWMMGLYIQSDVINPDYDKALFYAEGGLKLNSTRNGRILDRLKEFAGTITGRFKRKANEIIANYPN